MQLPPPGQSDEAGASRVARRPGHSRKVSQSVRCGADSYVSAVAKTEEEVSTAAQNAGADDADVLTRYTGPPVPQPRPQGHFLVRFWRSAVGKKWVMAVTGIILLGFVLVHMIGNLKLYLGDGAPQRSTPSGCATLGEPALPRTVAAVDAADRADRRVRRSTSSPRTSSRG